MESKTIFKISHKLREIRKEKSITLQELADRVGVSKGLISQIENNRTIPSLLVLINIISALHIDLNVFFEDFQSESELGPILIRRKNEYESFEKEQAEGFLYSRILTTAVDQSTVDIVLLELLVDSSRPMVETEALEYKYIIKGKIAYQFDDKTVELHAGDSILFNGRLAHTPQNIGNETALMLIVYFFDQRSK